MRIKEALGTEMFWSHLTLTFQQKGLVLNSSVFRACKFAWSNLRKRISRRYGPIRYVQSWEVHRTGWPHVHIAISNRELFDRPDWNPRARFTFTLLQAAVESGFGPVGWLEQLKSEEAMSGYLCKIARELTGSGKDYQVPVNAPKNFRRIRASVRLLPPPHKNPDITGVLRFCKLDDDTI